MRKPKILVYLEPPIYERIRSSARAHNRSISGEARAAIRQYLLAAADAHAAPLVESLMREQMGHLEAWLRPMTAATSIHAATAVLMALELLCGNRADPAKAKETLDLMRGRAYKMLRKRDHESDNAAPGQGAT